MRQTQTRYETTGWQPVFACSCLLAPVAKRANVKRRCPLHGYPATRIKRVFREAIKRKRER